jgi:Fe-S cluster assembly iron-binding protein IscA
LHRKEFDLMLKLTDDAVEAINGLVSDVPGAGLRISADATDNNQYALKVKVAIEPEPNDQVVEEQGSHVFVEPQVAPLVDGKTLDANSDDEGVSFRLLA